MITATLRRIAYRTMRARPDSLRAFKIDEVIHSLARLVLRFLRRTKRDRDLSENEYSRKAGYSVSKLHTREVPQYSIVDNEFHLGVVRETARRGLAERNERLSKLEFVSVLEVGAGELTTLNTVIEHFGAAKKYYALDISLNRIHHGLEFLKGRNVEVTALQADGSHIPFPDDSFDLVFTSHSLEQMPRIFRETVNEMIRVSRRHVVMFEPSYEGASLLQKLHARSMDYLRGLGPYLRTLSNVHMHPPFLMRNAINPFNRGTMFHIEKKNPGAPQEPRFVCPVSRGELQRLPDGYYSPDAGLFYPVVRGVPVLYRKYAQYMSPELVSAEFSR
jgi:ubiquinone/menaquinone biosynthesis C-methylase UbiE/uncharacterized protein YbaR (Trm112 family)